MLSSHPFSKILTIGLLVAIMSPCVFALSKKPPKHVRESTNITEKIKTGPFTSIKINGPFKVQIIGQQAVNQIELSSDPYELENIKVQLHNKVLSVSRIDRGHLLYYPVVIKISSSSLNNLEILGNGSMTASQLTGPLAVKMIGGVSANLSGNDINLYELRIIGPGDFTANGLQSRGLNFYHDGSGNVNLQGVAAFNSFSQWGTGQTTIPPIHNKKLVITLGGQNRVSFQGSVCVLEATLYGTAFLDAKNLHALRGYINTNDCSHAEIWVCNSLTAWAKNCSNIYYYTDPKFAARYMCPPASVLRMTGICTCKCCLL